ncbi:HNH endonuclease [Methylobacterium brachiatum]|uniref:HNH endonuclease n=1 Tax=Methylobacterium brachiatum TaxID=269660 RepID=UPI000EFAEC73|nr:HNH endonuclease [Methylobacterium brachiatum]AYO83598.1 HNH endonuclease [Methylobacterium brachiatum]
MTLMATRKPISARTRYRVLERDGYACQCCGARAPNVTLQVDHIKAVANGGSDEEENLRALCVTCNLGKSDLASNVIAIRPGVVPVTGPILRMPDLPDVRVHGDPLSQPIFWLGVQWAVTSYGVEARDGQYVIEADRLWEGEQDWGWIKQMRAKDWVDLQDFREALQFARQHFASLRKSG